MSKARVPLLGVVSIAVLLSVWSVGAHHSVVAEFDLEKPVTLRGTLTKLEWVNPHGFLYLKAKRADGELQDWKVETGSPVRMEKRGLKKGYFQTGHEIIVSGFLPKDGGRTMAGWIVNFPEREGKPGVEASFPLGR